ncbi:MraY family glycosyltransferase [Motilimonas sp. KMU-193]|uniref:MraY family glycosyltransferase n=1 Tax=Motilimonas sp. KMU-193 TaxID=3388668 RepID=UPI00396AF870
MISLLALLIICFIASLTLTGVLKWYAEHRLMDEPCHRSSHQHPTPSGGGMAIVLTYLFMAPIIVLFLLQPLEMFDSAFLLVWFGALAIALVGFIDDHVDLSARIRLIIQALVSCSVVWALGGFSVIEIAGIKLTLYWWLGFLLAWIGVIWFINLYNFMDGIDGLAGAEALIVCVVMAALYFIDDKQWTYNIGLVLIVAMASAGFLCWNFPPAKIFMGDGGSGFLGLTLASLMLIDAISDPKYLWVWLVMLGVFVVDATWTLLSRYIHNCKLSEAHRTHAFQYAVRQVQSHKKVTLAVVAINLFWLTPIAVLIVLGLLDGFIGMVISYIPLCYLAYHFNAGVPEK